jgi:hypothetical protein
MHSSFGLRRKRQGKARVYEISSLSVLAGE